MARRLAFTLLEVLTAIAIIALLLAVLLPAVQHVREAARRTTCRSNLRQLGLAIHAYSETHGQYPPGQSQSASAHVAILPFLEMSELYASFNYSGADPANATARATTVKLYVCPNDPLATDRGDGNARTNYSVNFGTGVQRYGYNGLFQHLGKGPIRESDVTDGLSKTAAMSEMLIGRVIQGDRLRGIWQTHSPLAHPDQLETFAETCAAVSQGTKLSVRGTPWTAGDYHTYYNHVLGPNENSCTNGQQVQEGIYSALSLHGAGVHLLFADGRVAFVSNAVERRIWHAYGSRNGGEPTPVEH